MNAQLLSDSRYNELLEKTVFSGYCDLTASGKRQLEMIETLGDAEAWEAELFRARVSDLQHELGPPSLTDHLQTLNVHTTDFELKRFYARTLYYKYPGFSTGHGYQIPIRTLDGQLRHFELRRCNTTKYGVYRDSECWKFHEQAGWPSLPRDFLVPEHLVTCLRPLDPDAPPSLIIGLGELLDKEHRETGFDLVWFLDQGKLGIVCDYIAHYDYDELEPDNESQPRPSTLNGDFANAGVRFSIAALEGSYRLEDGQSPGQELSSQLDQDITLSLDPVTYKGFLVENACRFEGMIQALNQKVVEDAASIERK